MKDVKDKDIIKALNKLFGCEVSSFLVCVEDKDGTVCTSMNGSVKDSSALIMMATEALLGSMNKINRAD